MLMKLLSTSAGRSYKRTPLDSSTSIHKALPIESDTIEIETSLATGLGNGISA